MAQRATASFGQKETETAAFASLTAADIVRAPIVSRRIPVDFRPLLKPHKMAGRLCLRIERLPQGAKLSAGRRGADNSWSLASDELEDLHFLVSSNVDRDYELAVRVMTYGDGEVSTLKVVPYIVSASDDAAPDQAGRDPHGQDPVIRSQLNEMHSLFAVRESELIELRAALQHAVEEREAELAKARSDWELELDRKVAEAVEQARVQDHQENEAKEAERKGRAAQEELRAAKIAAEREQAKGESERRSQAERQKWQSETTRRIEAARQEWKCEADRTLEAARQTWQAQSEEKKKKELESWKAESEKRIEAERRKWHAQAEDHVTKERDRWKSDADQRLEAARQAWQAEADERRRAELESLKAESERCIEAERQKHVAQAGEQAAKMRDLWDSGVDQRLETARQAWQAEADERQRAELEHLKAESELRIEAERQKYIALAGEQAAKMHDLWKSNADQRLEAARQAWQAEADELRKVERENWKADTERRIAVERETWLVQAGEHNRTEFGRVKAEIESRIGAERRNWQMQADEQAKQERARWEVTSEQRLEAARCASRAEAEAFLAVERARLEAEAEQRIAAERQRLESENAAASGQVDPETAQKLIEEKNNNRQLNTALLAQADKNRALEAALAAMTLRCENAERAPAAAENPAPAPEVEDGYIKSLRAEIATLRKSITNQAAELGRARAALEQTRPLHIQRSSQSQPLGNLRDVLVEDDQPAGQGKRKGLIRDCIVVAAVVIPLILFYPWIAVYLPPEVRGGIATATGGLLSVEIVQPAVPHAPPKKSLPPPKVERPTAVASRVLNVHASPASKGAVILSLQKNTSVAVLEKRGNWTEIEVPADGDGKPQQGWVWSAYLQTKDN